MASTFTDVNTKSIEKTIELLTYSASFGSGMGFRLSSSLNMALCIDLIMTLRYPFHQREKRLRLFWILCSLYSVSASVASNQLFGLGKTVQQIGLWVTLFVSCIGFYLLAIFSAIYSIRKLW